jgi:hypothetical protein
MYWINSCQDRDKRLAILYMAVKHWVPENEENF